VVAGDVAGCQYHEREEARPIKIFTITMADAGFRPGRSVRIIQQGRTATSEAVND
jgi:hypothetical protein